MTLITDDSGTRWVKIELRAADRPARFGLPTSLLAISSCAAA
jgi:hypothetical protein